MVPVCYMTLKVHFIHEKLMVGEGSGNGRSLPS